MAIAAVFARCEDASAQLVGEMGKRRFFCNTCADVQGFLLAAQRPLIVEQAPRRVERRTRPMDHKLAGIGVIKIQVRLASEQFVH